jgi:hypothetical protein
MTTDSAIKQLEGGRIGIGVLAWLVPRLAGRSFGIDPEQNPQAPYLSRLFGARDIALALGTLGSAGEARRRWLVAGVAIDSADAIAALAGGRAGYLSRVSTGLGAAAALSAVVLGAIALGGDGDAD